MLFGRIFNEDTQQLVFFERIPKLTPYERAIIKTWLPYVIDNVRMFPGLALRFFVHGEGFYTIFNNSICALSHGDIETCPASIRSILFEKQWLYRLNGKTGEKFHRSVKKNCLLHYKTVPTLK